MLLLQQTETEVREIYLDINLKEIIPVTSRCSKSVHLYREVRIGKRYQL